MSDWTVDKGAILGTSSLVLPAQCVECGRDASHETRVDTVLHWYPAWIWVGLIWGLLPVVLLYYAARRPLRISYSLCPEHRRTLVVKKRIIAGMWALFAFVAIVAVAAPFNSYLIAGALVLFVVTLIVHFAAGLSLRVTRHRKGIFTVIGFGQGFLAEVRHPFGHPHGELSPT